MAARKTRVQMQELLVDDVRVVVSRKRVKNINLRVRRDGSVAISAPASVSLTDIEGFVRSRRAWIAAAQERLANAQRYTASTSDDGAQVMLWGEALTVRVEAMPQAGRWPRCSFAVDGGTLLVQADARIADDTKESQQERDRQLDRWLQEQLIERVNQVLPICEETVGKHCNAWRLRHMTSRWGSCSVATGVVTLSTELVHHPQRCLDYVITHELCHLYEPSHNARFHALMDRFYPSWREVRSQLNGR